MVFEGIWKDNKANGWGKLIQGDSKGNLEFYEGEWEDDKANGKGKYKGKKFEYEGEWKNDLFDGQGKLEIYNESVYEG